MDRKVTALKVQMRNPNRVNVYLDGEFAFGLSRIVAAWLKVGQTISDEKLTAIQQKETAELALQRALLVLSYRPRSEAEIQKKLDGAGFEPDVVQATLSRLREGGMVQDERFASAWIESRSTFRPRSQRFLAFELRQKGITNEVIDRALADAASDDQLAYQAANRYARRLQGLDWVEFRKKLTAFLGRRGFSYGTVNSVVEQVWQEQAESHSSNTSLDHEELGNG